MTPNRATRGWARERTAVAWKCPACHQLTLRLDGDPDPDCCDTCQAEPLTPRPLRRD